MKKKVTKNCIINWIKQVLRKTAILLKQAHNHIVKHNPIWNSYITITLVLVSVIMIFATIYSATTAVRLGEIETYMVADKSRQEMLAQKIMAENLLIETSQNKRELLIYIDTLETLKNTTEAYSDDLNILRVQQAKDMVLFGSVDIREKIDNYLDAMKKIKNDLAQIERSSRLDEYKIKSERISRTIRISKDLIEES